MSACRDQRPPGNIIVLGTTNSATNLDPRVGTDEASQKIHQLIFNALVHIDRDLRIVPELAESIEHPDPLTYVARLRRGESAGFKSLLRARPHAEMRR